MPRKVSPHRVFLCYLPKEWAYARTLAGALEKLGLKVLDPLRSTLPGDNPGHVLGGLLEEANAIVLVVSSKTLLSRNVRDLLGYAVGKGRFEDRVIPILRTESSSPPPFAESHSIRDLGDADATAAAVAEQLGAKAPLGSRRMSA